MNPGHDGIIIAASELLKRGEGPEEDFFSRCFSLLFAGLIYERRNSHYDEQSAIWKPGSRAGGGPGRAPATMCQFRGRTSMQKKV